MRVFVTGARGLIGHALSESLLAGGHEVVGLSRSPEPLGLSPGARRVAGDPATPGSWLEELAHCDACVHLAGEPIAGGRWTEARKARIRDSRILSTRLVARAIAQGGPRVLVSGSAVGYYGPRGDEALDESAPPGDDFLSRLCQAWEAAALEAAPRARVVLLRSGIVLAEGGGALQELVRPFHLFLGGPIGQGAFFEPWIHLADEVALIRFALEDGGLTGPVNATAPNPVRNRELARAIGRVLGRPSLVKVPPLALRLALGELSSVVASGQRAIPKKALERGFTFRFPELLGALEDLLTRKVRGASG
ncbi:MAG TPA: TIGR01777 family oxidoreductase [Anaeromyxobacteraceae bacterium]|nr:TIGR01777 family oxidoreductase [Anaeromyxobacteraceae bacterium]